MSRLRSLKRLRRMRVSPVGSQSELKSAPLLRSSGQGGTAGLTSGVDCVRVDSIGSVSGKGEGEDG